jgi:hypothetical protein
MSFSLQVHLRAKKNLRDRPRTKDSPDVGPGNRKKTTLPVRDKARVIFELKSVMRLIFSATFVME